MAFDDLLNILLVGLLFLVIFFHQRRKRAKKEEDDHEKMTMQQIAKPPGRQKTKDASRETIRIDQPHEALSERYKDDPASAYRLDKETTTSRGKKLFINKSSIKKGIIVSEIMKRPYD